jgi:hypothetical protein
MFSKIRRLSGVALVCLGWLLLLSACSNQYGPPPADDGKPENWGQQHYLDNHAYQQTIDQQQSD